jgi:hypothetical protein
VPWARASALHRHLACPAASWFPRADRGVWSPGYLVTELPLPADLPPVPKQDMRYADWGTAMHEAKAGGDAEPFASYLAPYREQMWPAKLGRHEVCVAWDCRRHEVILGPANLPKAEQDAWKAAKSEDHVVGVSDWLGELPAGDAWIDDLKTGWSRPDPAAVANLFYLFCWARARQQDLGWSSMTWWPRGTEHPTREGLWRKVTSVAFEALEDAMNDAWLSATRGHHDPRPGMHCGYCPSAAVCPRAHE